METKLFTRSNFALAVAGAFAALALTVAACADTSGAQQGTATMVPAKSATVVVNDPAEPRPQTTPTETPSDDPLASPRVLWMTSTHAGAGALTIQIESDVPTTAQVSVSTGHAGDNTQLPAPESDTALATRHTISIGTYGQKVMVEAVVTDAQGHKAHGDLVFDQLPSQFWGVGQFGPNLSMQGKLAGIATWTNVKGVPGPVRDGAVILLSKRAGCTTADACMPQFVSSFDSDNAANSADGASETHSIAFSRPDSTHDYVVLLEGQPAADGSYAQFYQFDVAAGAAS
jgi:hypothetical protein